MALQINDTITTREGFSVPSGTIVRFNTIFPSDTLEVHYNMKFYRNQTSYDNGESNYFPMEPQSMGYVETVAANEYTGLTPTIVNQKLKDYLGTIFTGGTIDIIL
jgi:hypothetical protein